MTYPFDELYPYHHVHISEREAPHRWPDGQLDSSGWEDCLFTSYIELERFGGGDVPATLYEAEALRADSGVRPLGPANIFQVLTGAQKRYGHTLDNAYGETALLALKSGQAALVAGSLANFPSGHALRRWQPNYDAGHGIALYRFTERWWWCDPLAPSWYSGQWVSDAQTTQFMYNNSTFGYVTHNEFKEIPMLPFIDARNREVDIRTGANLIDENGQIVRTLTAQATVIAPFISDYVYTAVFARIDGKDVLVRAKSNDIVGTRRLTPETELLIAQAKAQAKEGLYTKTQLDSQLALAKAVYEMVKETIADELDTISAKLRT